jgi:hypothetical protein
MTTNEPTKPPGVVLLEMLVEQQIETNKLLTQLLSDTGARGIRGYLSNIQGWLCLIFIILVLGGCYSVTTIVERYSR